MEKELLQRLTHASSLSSSVPAALTVLIEKGRSLIWEFETRWNNKIKPFLKIWQLFIWNGFRLWTRPGWSAHVVPSCAWWRNSLVCRSGNLEIGLGRGWGSCSRRGIDFLQEGGDFPGDLLWRVSMHYRPRPMSHVYTNFPHFVNTKRGNLGRYFG